MDTMSDAEKTTVGGNADRLLNSLEVAELLGLLSLKAPTESVRHLCRRRLIKYAKIGRSFRFRRRWVDEYIERQATEPLSTKAWR